MTTKIVCRALNCIFNEDRICTSEQIVYDPDEGCLTYEELNDVVSLDEDDEDWEDDDLVIEDDDDDFLLDDDLLLDEDEEEDEDLELEDEDEWEI